jgi:hypothetical protein
MEHATGTRKLESQYIIRYQTVEKWSQKGQLTDEDRKTQSVHTILVFRNHAKANVEYNPSLHRSRDIAIHIRYNSHLNSMTPCLTSHLLASATFLTHLLLFSIISQPFLTVPTRPPVWRFSLPPPLSLCSISARPCSQATFV